ncbi:MAG: glutamate--tRNA ligase, partial [Mariprofundaceae bacterium]|nr:glutamate--tRNA ligase [Mariprofundaceae bacterium]
VQQAEALPEWTAQSAHALIENVCEVAEVNMGKLAQPIRILLSGGPVSPPIDVTLELLGLDETIKRIQVGMKALRQG